MIVKADGSPHQEQKTVQLSRQQMKMFQDFEQFLERLGLQYWMRCPRCLAAGDPMNGVRGNNMTNASTFIVECNCTKYVYQGADVKHVH